MIYSLKRSGLKGLSYSSAVLGALALLGAGCPTAPAAPAPPLTKTAAPEVNMSPTETVMKKADDMMKVKADGTMATLTAPLMLSDGTKVMPTGEIIKPDGEKKMMAEGESITMEGEVVKTAPALPTPAPEPTPTKKESKPTLTEEIKKMMRPGSYETYDPAKLVYAENGTVVLFFHAAWCPTCRAADSNFRASALPDGLTILKIDYDTSTDLKRKYGITYQHTYVQVDAQGNLIKKWSRSTTLDEILNELSA